MLWALVRNALIVIALYAVALGVIWLIRPALFHTLFSWPDGIVVGNLIASLMWLPTALIHLDRRAQARHEELITARRAASAADGTAPPAPRRGSAPPG